jgi:hypothetical protein
MASIVGGTRGLDHSLDRISKSIYQNAVRRNRQEQEHVARWAYLKDLIPPVVRPMTEPSISHERFANPSANATRSCNFSIGWSGESVRA